LSKTGQILRTAARNKDFVNTQVSHLKTEREELDKYLEREEEEKWKDEGQKRHERYRRKQMSTDGADLTNLIKLSKPVEQKPGTYFYGTLKKLGEDFDNDIIVMEKHFTLGQSAKYSPNTETNKIYSTVSGDVLYDCDTGECFENNS